MKATLQDGFKNQLVTMATQQISTGNTYCFYGYMLLLWNHTWVNIGNTFIILTLEEYLVAMETHNFDKNIKKEVQ